MKKPPVLWLFSFFIILNTLGLFSCASNERKGFFRLHPVWQREADLAGIFDADGDGIDEILLQYGIQIDLQDWRLKYYHQSFSIAMDESFGVQPFYSAGIDSVYYFVHHRTADTVFVDILPPDPLMVGKSIPKSHLKYFFSIPRSEKSAPVNFYQCISFWDHWTDARGDRILMRFNTSWDTHGLRGVSMYRPGANAVEWTYSVGPSVYAIVHRDVDGDGAHEIFLSTYATHNGVRGGSTLDDSCTVFALNDDGSLMWKRTVGPYWTGVHCQLADLAGQGRDELVCVHYGVRQESPKWDGLMILDPLTGQLRQEKEVGEQINSPNVFKTLVIDHDSDGREEIVIAFCEGYIGMYDDQLNPVLFSEVFGRNVRILSVLDMDGDGKDEIVAHILDEKLIVLNSNLEVLCEYALPFKRAISAYPVHVGERCHFLLKAGSKVILLELQKSPIPFPSMAAPLNPFLWSLPLVLGIVFFAAVYFSRRQWVYRLFLQVTRQAGLLDSMMLIDPRGTIRFLGQNLASLLRIDPEKSRGMHVNRAILKREVSQKIMGLVSGMQNEAEIVLPDSGTGQVILMMQSRYLPFFRLFSLYGVDGTEHVHIQQVKHWAKVAQSLAHGIKSPLSTLKLNVDQLRRMLKKEGRYDVTSRYVQGVYDQLDCLSRMSDGFMKFLEFEKLNKKQLVLNDFIQDQLNECQPLFREGLTLYSEFDSALSKVLFDPTQLKLAFCNVLTNAVESLGREGAVTVSTRLLEWLPHSLNGNGHGPWAEIRVQDTGCGMSPEILDRAIQPYVTAKKGGTGLGLSITHKVMEVHNGHLDVQSSLGEGTTILMFLPLGVSCSGT